MELMLPARAESLAIVRDALRALGSMLAVDEQRLADICLAVTEACTNVVLHAYPDEDGPLDIVVWACGAGEARRERPAAGEAADRNGDSERAYDERACQEADEPELTVIVGDCGRGTHEPPRTPGLGLGLQLISALTKSARVISGEDGRTEVEMTFALVASSPSATRSLTRATVSPR
jgi:two-component sensor histidine kinase